MPSADRWGWSGAAGPTIDRLLSLKLITLNGPWPAATPSIRPLAAYLIYLFYLDFNPDAVTKCLKKLHSAIIEIYLSVVTTPLSRARRAH
jgi:hypothetical protein